MAVPFSHFSHVSVVVSSLKHSRKFYEGVLGLKRIPRPQFPFEGEWYTLGGRVELHIIVNHKRTHRWKTPKGLEIAYPHFALWVPSIDDVYRRLSRAKFPKLRNANHQSRLIDYASTPTDARQTFLFDPDGNMIELLGPLTRRGRKEHAQAISAVRG